MPHLCDDQGQRRRPHQGVTVVAAQLKVLSRRDGVAVLASNYDAQGFPDAFPVRVNANGGELCLQPQIARMPRFDAVAFQTPAGETALVAMNIGDEPIEFSLVDKAAKAGVTHLTIPPHAIHTYTWRSSTVVQSAVVQEAITRTPAARRPAVTTNYADAGGLTGTKAAATSLGAGLGTGSSPLWMALLGRRHADYSRGAAGHRRPERGRESDYEAFEPGDVQSILRLIDRLNENRKGGVWLSIERGQQAAIRNGDGDHAQCRWRDWLSPRARGVVGSLGAAAASLRLWLSVH